MRYGPRVQGRPVRWTCIRALCPRPDAFASRKSQGIPLLVLKVGERGSGWNHGSHVTDRKMGSERKGDSAQVRQPHLLLEETGWASGLGQHTYLPHDGQLHGTPGVGSPVHQAGQEVSKESPCHCGQEEGELEVGMGGSRARPCPLPIPTQEVIRSVIQVRVFPSLLGTLCSL